MTSTLQNQLDSIWNYFNKITTIPRASKKEDKIRHYLLTFAEQQQLKATTDKAGNVLICKPGSANKFHEKGIVLQTHMDMVCEKNSDIVHDFDTNPIQTYIDGDWLKANGTTLGADNGIGIAIKLAVLADSTITHPALECLFTVDEETGLYGATYLDEKMLQSSTLINLDTEEEGEFCIGCAGGMDTLANIPKIEENTPEDFFFFKVKIGGLLGGHSGEDINKGRANAIKLLSRYLGILQDKTDIRIVRINGGNLRNAIAREAEATLVVPYADKELVRIEINHFIAEVETEFDKTEKQLTIELESSDKEKTSLCKSLSDKLISALNACPHGVIEMNTAIPTLVETSTNLAAIHTLDSHIFIETSQRSANEQKKNAIANKVASVFSVADAEIKKGKDYPGWEPNLQSEILSRSIIAYEKLFDKKPLVKVIHAGLECGVIAKKYPKMDMISIGPTIVDAHSPSERVSISSVEKCWILLLDILNAN